MKIHWDFLVSNYQKMVDIVKELANQYLEQSQREREDENLKAREKAITLLETKEGALKFVEDLKHYGSNEKGEPLRISPWLEEYARLVGDLRVAEVYTSGAAQIGKSLIAALFYFWLVVECRLNALYVFAEFSALQRMVTIQFYPLFRNWLNRKGEKQSSQDTKNKQMIQHQGSTALFTYAGTRNQSREGRAAAGGQIVSFSVDCAFMDEKSQYAPNAESPIQRRLDAGRLPTRPIREIGTPGSGQGIEKSIENADLDFYPHVFCPHCGEETSLHPFGALFKPRIITDDSGEKIIKYLSESGKPEEWYYKDDRDPIGSAYFACQHCHGELDQEARINAHFTCLKTGKHLTEFLDNFDTNDQKRWKAGITLSPLLRESKLNLASEIIQNGLTTSDTNDYQQQRLGVPSQDDSAGLTVKQIIDAIKAPDIETDYRQAVYTLAGLDQGRSTGDWLVIADYVLPLGHERMSLEEIIDQTVRIVLFGSNVNRGDVGNIAEKYGVEYGVLDNEPSITTGAELARELGWDMANQIANQKDAIKKTTVFDGGQEFLCWNIRNSKFLKQVKNTFLLKHSDGYPLMRLPPEWEKWENNPTEMSPIRHLTAITYNNEVGMFVRPQDHVDDYYFAIAFMEVAFYLKLTGNESYISSLYDVI